MDVSYFAVETSARVAPEPRLFTRADYDPAETILQDDEEMYQDVSNYPDLSRIMASPGQKIKTCSTRKQRNPPTQRSHAITDATDGAYFTGV